MVKFTNFFFFFSERIDEVSDPLYFLKDQTSHYINISISFSKKVKIQAIMFAYKTTTCSAPLYLNSLLQTYVPSRSLRSASEQLYFAFPNTRATNHIHGHLRFPPGRMTCHSGQVRGTPLLFTRSAMGFVIQDKSGLHPYSLREVPWDLSFRTSQGYTPTLYEKCHGIFNVHRELGPRFNVSSERRLCLLFSFYSLYS